MGSDLPILNPKYVQGTALGIGQNGGVYVTLHGRSITGHFSSLKEAVKALKEHLRSLK